MAAAMIPRWHAAEMKIDAVRLGDKDLVLHYILAQNPSRSLEQAERLLAEWVAHPQNAEMARLFGA